jgi:hypothetical protein
VGAVAADQLLAEADLGLEPLEGREGVLLGGLRLAHLLLDAGDLGAEGFEPALGGGAVLRLPRGGEQEREPEGQRET